MPGHSSPIWHTTPPTATIDMIDTHTHLYMADYDTDGQPADSMTGQTDAVDRAVAAGISHMILPNVDLASVGPMQRLHALRPEATSMAIGLHPTEVLDDADEVMERLDSIFMAAPEVYRAIGEIGMDLYWDASRREQQMRAFDRQLGLAAAHHKPVIIHCREALDPTLEVLQGYAATPCVFHSFGGTPVDVERILATVPGAYFGINGIVTFKNSRLADTLPAIPAERILTETDAPFLAPVPKRGSRNESAYIPYILERIASALDTVPAQLDVLTTANACRLFNLKLKQN